LFTFLELGVRCIAQLVSQLNGYRFDGCDLSSRALGAARHLLNDAPALILPTGRALIKVQDIPNILQSEIGRNLGTA
jgi:hypothetical protein